MKKLLILIVLAVCTTATAGETTYPVGTRVNAFFTAIQARDTGTADTRIHPVGTFWMEQGRIFKCYEPNIVREIMIDLSDPEDTRGCVPASVWCQEGKLFIMDGQYVFQHDPVWKEQTVQHGWSPALRTVPLFNPFTGCQNGVMNVPELLPVVEHQRILKSEWIVVSSGNPVWLEGTIEAVPEQQNGHPQEPTLAPEPELFLPPAPVPTPAPLLIPRD